MMSRLQTLLANGNLRHYALGMSMLTFFVKRLPSRGAGPFKAFGSFLVCVILNFLSHVLGRAVHVDPGFPQLTLRMLFNP